MEWFSSWGLTWDCRRVWGFVHQEKVLENTSLVPRPRGLGTRLGKYMLWDRFWDQFWVIEPDKQTDMCTAVLHYKGNQFKMHWNIAHTTVNLEWMCMCMKHQAQCACYSSASTCLHLYKHKHTKYTVKLMLHYLKWEEISKNYCACVGWPGTACVRFCRTRSVLARVEGGGGVQIPWTSPATGMK